MAGGCLLSIGAQELFQAVGHPQVDWRRLSRRHGRFFTSRLDLEGMCVELGPSSSSGSKKRLHLTLHLIESVGEFCDFGMKDRSGRAHMNCRVTAKQGAIRFAVPPLTLCHDMPAGANLRGGRVPRLLLDVSIWELRLGASDVYVEMGGAGKNTWYALQWVEYVTQLKKYILEWPAGPMQVNWIHPRFVEWARQPTISPPWKTHGNTQCR